MATGFIYVVRSATNYQQPAFCSVPTQWGDRLYFGPCKKPMRPKMERGDHVFGLSPAGTTPRRILFAALIEEHFTFREAYHRFPDLRGPMGPIHVQPINGTGSFPQSSYQHIPGSMHPDEWKADLTTPDMDRFFVFREAEGWLGKWLGAAGPEIDDEILSFLNTCFAFGKPGCLGPNTGTLQNPVAYHRLFTGLHLETDKPEELLAKCHSRMAVDDFDVELDPVLPPRRPESCPGEPICTPGPSRRITRCT